jgi:hypothetical protein
MPQTEPVEADSVWTQFGEAIGAFVNHPDYYKGRWFVQWRGGRRVCSNHTTASAWCKYLRRNFNDGWTATIGRADPLPGFPRRLH